MIRAALLLCAGLLTAMCIACAAPPQPVAGGGVPVALTTWPLASCDARTFADSVRTLPDSFDPTHTDTDPPQGGVLDQDIHDDLQTAFGAAPSFLQTRLCGLNGVYVTPTASWGYRNSVNKQRYVAIPAALWSEGTAARRTPKSYKDYENDIVRGLLPSWAGLQYQPDPGGPANSGITTILAALAHEVGHVLWYDIYVPTPRTAMQPGNFCNGKFYTESWDDLGDTPPSNRWRKFGLVSGAHKSNDVQIDDIKNAPPGQRGKKVAVIYRTHGTPAPRGRWANLFAAFSPEEDFVETFKLFVLQRANNDPNHPLHLKAKIKENGVSIIRDIPGTLSQRPVLQRKLACFAQIFP
jgi:hypothetical protein